MRFALLFLCGAVAGCPNTAVAQSSEPTSSAAGQNTANRELDNASQRSTEALQLGHQGLRAYQAGDYHAAESFFAAAEQKMHSPVFLLYRGRSYEHLRAWVSARVAYASCASELLPDEAPSAWRDAQEQAQSGWYRLAARVGQVELRLEGAQYYPLRLRIVPASTSHLTPAFTSADAGEELGGASQEWLAAGGAELSVNSAEQTLSFELAVGSYEVVIDESDSRRELLLQVRGGESQSLVVSLAPLDATHPETENLPVASRLLPLEESSTVEPHRSRLRSGAYAAMGSGALLLLGGLTLQGVAVAEAVSVRNDCENNVCQRSQLPAAQRAIRHFNLGTAGVVSGVVGLGFGLGLWAFDLHSQRQLRVQTGLGHLSIAGTF